MDLDDTELKMTTATEYRTPFGSMNDLRTENIENVERTPAPKMKEYRSVSTSGSSPKADRSIRKRRETELDAEPNRRRTENVSPRRKTQSTDQTYGRSMSSGTPKGHRKRLHWAEIEDVLAPTKINGSSSDTKSEPISRRPNSRRASSSRKPKSPARAKRFTDSSSEDKTCVRSKPKHILKPPKFDGIGSFETFLAQFQYCAVYNQWTEAEKLVYLRDRWKRTLARYYGTTAPKRRIRSRRW